MNTKVGQTISASEFNKAYPIGTNLSAKEFIDKYGSKQSDGGKDQISREQPIESAEQPIESAISKTGLFDPLVVGGLLRGAESSVESYGRMVGGGLVQAPVLAATGGRVNIPFLSEQDLQKFSQPSTAIPETIGRTAGMMSTVAGVKALPSLLRGITQLPQAISKYGTTGRTFQTMEKAAKAGRSIDWEKEVAQKAREIAKIKPTSVKQELENLLTEEKPTENIRTIPEDIAAGRPVQYSYQGVPQMSSSQALELRGELGGRLSKDVFGRLKIPVSSARQQATDILRRTVSDVLKKAAPSIKTPDKVYSFYKGAHGDAPTWAKRYIIAKVAENLLPKNLRGPLSDAILMLLEIGLKI